MNQSIGYIIEAGIIAFILFFQIRFFISNIKKRRMLSSILPKEANEHFTVEKDEEGIAQIIVSNYSNPILNEEIIEPINAYLRENKGATDYHIIKDLTDRSCDKVQEEVDSYNPIPLYLGLCGTMLGIIAGIFFLWKGGGLDALLSTPAANTTPAMAQIASNAASQGIQHLLGGVALAMIASFVGVFMTILSTKWTKSAVATNEDGRNKFLSWIQCNLLPRMSSDVVSTLGVFYSNLNNFNNIFSQNSKDLKSAFEQIQAAYQKQTQYTRELNKLDIDKAQIAFASLGSATEKINDLNLFLRDSSTYIAKIIELNSKLDAADERTKAIEEMGIFFKNEIEQIKARKALLSEAVGKIDIALNAALDGLQTSSKEHVGKLQENLARIYVDFQNAVSDQQKLLKEKLSESSALLEQFQRLESIENKLSRLDDIAASVSSLGGRLDTLQVIVKSIGNSIGGNIGVSSNNIDNKDVKVNVKLPIPTWLGYLTSIILILAGLFSIVFPLLGKFGII